VYALLDRVWELRDNLSAYDASYIALAELLSCNLVTADRRLSRAPGIGCPVTVVPRERTRRRDAGVNQVRRARGRVG